MDGNFKIEQSKPKRPEDDVALTSGTGMMTAEAEYKAHLKVAAVIKGARLSYIHEMPMI